MSNLDDTHPLVEHSRVRLEGLRQERNSWQAHWSDLATYILPRRHKWLVQANNAQRGSMMNSQILDATGTIAARNLAAGMMSGITSPTRPWFKLRVEGQDTESSNPISIWLAEVEKRMMRVFSESNFYTSMGVLYFDLAVFGSAVMLIYEDFDDVIRCYNPAPGEYFLGNSPRLAVDTVYREFVLTVGQIVARWGKNNVSSYVAEAHSRGKAELQHERIICHAIEPNSDRRPGSPPAHFPFREIYWELGERHPLEIRGFNEFPALCPRWDIVSNDAYGRSPGMDALPDIRQLQQETRRKGQAIDKMVNPPMLADIQLKGQPASLLPGGVTYVAGNNNTGFKPVYQVTPPVNELMLDIQEIQNRIRTIFHNDLFLMFQQLDAEPRSAAAVDVRREEKMVMLGPVLERFENEALDPAIDRTFNRMWRAGLLPPPPPELQGNNLRVEYVSMLATAQRATATAGIERLLGIAGSMTAVDPTVIDNIDPDQALISYAGYLNVEPKVMRDREEVAGLRQQRAEAQAKQEQMVDAAAAVEGAQVLSKTDVGGGLNALQALTGGTIQ